MPSRAPLAAAALAAAATLLSTPQPASAWAPAGSAPIHPGVQTVTGGSNQCTANFVFSDSAGNVYIGQAAHCASRGAATDTNGCTTPSMGLNTNVSVGGASRTGKLVYSSWLTMQARHETNTYPCQYNDFALVKLDAADVGRVNPSVPFWGGPRAVRSGPLVRGEQVVSYGNSGLRFGITTLSPKQGVALGTAGYGWTHPLYTATPGIPGDSGSGFMDANGDAFGVLSTISALTTNNAGDLKSELDYMHAYSTFTSVNLVPGDVQFTGPLP
ncbi:MAG TPA: serine protease [Mycobacteriales bacterium]|jgi:hypothetical protein|nr:serine protease [Mycobacteriales bacterium]